MSQIGFKKRILPIKDQLYRFAARILNNATEAEDVVQEVLVKLWQQRQDWGNIKNMEAWSMRLTKNMAIDKLRSKHKRTEQIDQQFDLSTQDVTPDRQAELQDTMQHIESFMAQLPEKQRMVIQLRDVEGMSYQEIADILEIPLNQVKVNLFRARKQLRNLLIKTESYGL